MRRVHRRGVDTVNIHLIAVHYDNKLDKELGFRLLDSTSEQVMDVAYDNVLQVLNEGKAKISGLELKGNKLVGSNGVLDRYSKIIDKNLMGSSPVVVLNEIGDEGYTVSDWKGTIKRYKNDAVIMLADNMGIANGKVVNNSDGKRFISAIRGNYDRIELQPKVEDKKEGVRSIKKGVTKEKVKDEVKKRITVEPVCNDGIDLDDARAKRQEEIKADMHRGRTTIQPPKISGGYPARSKLKELDEKTGMTVEQKLTQALLVVRSIRPFYYSVLATIRRVESDELDTMGVTIDSLYYNSEFIKNLELPQLVFVLIHEVLHISMQHNMRQGVRMHKVWNIACDFFINKLICEEFEIDTVTHKKMTSDPYNVGIKFADGGLYNDTVNIQTETPEKIYDELMSEINKQLDKDQSMLSEGGGEQGDQEQSGGTGEDQTGDRDQQDRGYGQDNDQGKDQESQDGSQEGQEDSGDKSKEDKKDGGKEGGTKLGIGRIADVTFRGDKVGKLVLIDLIEDARIAQMSDTQKESLGRSVLERSIVLQKQIGSFGDDSDGYLERYIKEVLAPKVNWRTLLKNKLTKASQYVSTYSRPDRRFLSRNMILPGPKRVDNDSLENVKVCIDTSGSITDEELGVALAQIKQLLDTFKAEAELLYWDTQVRVDKPFKDVQELVRIRPKGGGGTNVNCVFEYFREGDYKKRLKQQPSIIIIFTDGWFGEVESRHKRYGRDTIWVLSNNDNFEEPFGVKAKLTDVK